MAARDGRFDILRLVVPVAVLLVAVGLYSAAEGATVCLDFENTCTGKDIEGAAFMQDLSLILAVLGGAGLYVGCRQARLPLRLDISSSHPTTMPPRRPSVLELAAVTGIAAVVIGAGLAFAPAGTALLTLIAAPVIAFAVLPVAPWTRVLFAGIVIFLIFTILFGGPFLALMFILIATFVILSATLLAAASKGL